MPSRKVSLETGKVYHIFSKSIAGFKIFRNDSEYARMKSLVKYYNIANPPWKFALFLEIKNKDKVYNLLGIEKDKLVNIISYCFMPTHIHLVLKGLKSQAISTFMRKILNSYAKFFNNKTKRKGPLWQSRFKNILVETDEQLIHLTRYIHLNPTTAYLADKPEDWKFSSYREFLNNIEDKEKICNFSDTLDTNPKNYKNFVNSQIDYQKELSRLKKLWIE